MLWAAVIFCSQATRGEVDGEAEMLGSSQDFQPSPENSGLFEPYNSFKEESGWKRQLWGRPFRDHIYLGMWTVHFKSGEEQENTNNLVGLSWQGYYGGTFVNTHCDQVYSGGVQRSVFIDKWGNLEVEAGYRLGMMYGYTKYLTLGGSRWFPLFQTLLDIDYKGFGIEFSWAGVVATAGFYFRF